MFLHFALQSDSVSQKLGNSSPASDYTPAKDIKSSPIQREVPIKDLDPKTCSSEPEGKVKNALPSIPSTLSPIVSADNSSDISETTKSDTVSELFPRLIPGLIPQILNPKTRDEFIEQTIESFIHGETSTHREEESVSKVTQTTKLNGGTPTTNVPALTTKSKQDMKYDVTSVNPVRHIKSSPEPQIRSSKVVQTRLRDGSPDRFRVRSPAAAGGVGATCPEPQMSPLTKSKSTATGFTEKVPSRWNASTGRQQVRSLSRHKLFQILLKIQFLGRWTLASENFNRDSD